MNEPEMILRKMDLELPSYHIDSVYERKGHVGHMSFITNLQLDDPLTDEDYDYLDSKVKHGTLGLIDGIYNYYGTTLHCDVSLYIWSDDKVNIVY